MWYARTPSTGTQPDQHGNKYSLKNAHMGHNPEDAVFYWNRCGCYHGAKSQTVRKWMLDSNNYRLEYGLGNRSRGAKSKERYKKTRKPKNGKLPKSC